MLSIKMLVPPYSQLKLHIEAQISSGVPALHKLFPHVEPSSFSDNSIFLAFQVIEEFYPGNKQYGFLPHYS